MWRVASPCHSLWSGLHISLSNLGYIGIFRRPVFTVVVGHSELGPRPAYVDQPADECESVQRQVLHQILAAAQKELIGGIEVARRSTFRQGRCDESTYELTGQSTVRT